ncbi:MAG TPA: flagellar biosynthesis protein FlhA [Candidatus Acidoferrales bacterium]|nr:flagellar biosynthesis protein FlhA [Candidatus Acidoferrales bacterium]
MTPAKTIAVPAPSGAAGWLQSLGSGMLGEMAVPLAVLAIVIALITPLPGFVLDLLIVIDILVSVTVLMVALYLVRPVDFTSFPTTLLLLTLFRLALNISSSRLILLNGNTGTSAAGEVIGAFGSFVVGGNYVIGAVIFLVLIAIQYVVINHGAVRISEVTARFTLDALPGKQMSIDSDLNAGLVDEAEAKRRRKALATEAEFYGAMDGASRFTQRDAVASILITAINIVAGFLIGVLQHAMDFRRALETYTVLTIGDGLVTVIPALMISISGGLIVTRASSDSRLGSEFRRQILGNSQPVLLAGGVLLALALLPSMPKAPFLLLGCGAWAAGWQMRKKELAQASTPAEESKPAQAKENIESLLRVEPLAIEVGLGLVGFVEGAQDSALLRRISAIRRQLASELGYLLPPVRVADNLSLRSREYVISLKGVEISRYELPQSCELAIPTGAAAAAQIEGQPTRDPAFGMNALWIPSERAERARHAGYTVVDSVSVLGTHLSEVIRRHAHELFSRQDAKRLLDRVAVEHPKVVEDVVPKLLPLATVQRVLQNLLRERVSIRDAVSILEALGEAGASTRNPILLTEYVRQSIRRTVIKPYLNRTGDLPAWFIDPAIEQAVEASVEHGEQNSHLAMPPQQIRDILSRITTRIQSPETPQVTIASSGARYFLRQMVEPSLANLFVLAHNEVPPGVRVQSLGNIQ